MKNYILIVLGVIAVLVLARLSFYTVDAAEYVYVTVLGEHRDTYDGGDKDEAGLRFGWPWPILHVQRLDRRLQQFDLPPAEQLTHDPKGKTVDKILLLEAYVCWKIADKDGADLFVKRIGNVTQAPKILAPEITGKLGAAIGKKRMDDFLIDPQTGKSNVDDTVSALRDELLTGLKDRFRKEYGIELVDIRLRRFNHPASVRNSIFERIKSERNKEAQKHESDGRFLAAEITTKADEEITKARALAKTQEEEIKTKADITANKIRNDAYSQDLKFFEFVKQVETMQSILGGERTMLLLSTNRAVFNILKGPTDKDKKGDK